MKPAAILPSPSPTRSDAAPLWRRRAGVWLWLAIGLATFAVYLPALRGGLIMDDDVHLTKAALRSWHGLWLIWTNFHSTGHYFPILHSAFWLEHRLWGDAVVGYHLVNLAQHTLAACLVVLIARKLSLPGAWLAGFVFALHPVCVESVAWMSEQKNTLSAVFYLSAALVYLQFDESRDRKHYFWAAALFLCAVFSKTVTVTLPAALLVVLWWKRGHINLRRDVRPLAPWLVAGLAAGMFTTWVEHTYMGAHGREFALSFAQRLLLAGRLPVFYAGKLLRPVNLIFTYPQWAINAADWHQWLYPLGIVALVCALLLPAIKKPTTHQPSPTTRGPLSATLFFIGTLFPVLGFLNVSSFRYSWAADHYQYLASLGLIVPFCAIMWRPEGRGALWLRALCPALLLVLAVLTFHQCAEYCNAETLYRTTIARNPGSWVAYNNLGVALADAGRVNEAIEQYQTAIQIKPDYAKPHNNLATIYSRWPGHLGEAIAESQAAISIAPDDANAHVNLASYLAKTGKLQEAVAESQAAIRIDADLAEAHNNLGLELSNVPGRLPDAVHELETAVRLEPENAQFHDNLAEALLRIPGRNLEAIAEVQASIELVPSDPQAHDFLGRALSQISGRLPDALAEFETALRIAPAYAQAHNDLGVVLLYIPSRRGEAIAQFRAALTINPNDPLAQNNLQRALSQP